MRDDRIILCRVRVRACWVQQAGGASTKNYGKKKCHFFSSILRRPRRPEKSSCYNIYCIGIRSAECVSRVSHWFASPAHGGGSAVTLPTRRYAYLYMYVYIKYKLLIYPSVLCVLYCNERRTLDLLLLYIYVYGEMTSYNISFVIILYCAQRKSKYPCNEKIVLYFNDCDFLENCSQL